MNILLQPKAAKKSAALNHLTSSRIAAVRSPENSTVPAANPDTRPPGIQTILVAANSSEALFRILSYAYLFTEQFGSKLIIMYFVTNGAANVGLDEMREEIFKVVGIKTGSLQAIFFHPEMISHAQVVDAARIETADLIMISADFNDGQTHFLGDGAIMKLIHHTASPVLVIKN